MLGFYFEDRSSFRNRLHICIFDFLLICHCFVSILTFRTLGLRWLDWYMDWYMGRDLKKKG